MSLNQLTARDGGEVAAKRPSASSPPSSRFGTLKEAWATTTHHLTRHVGVGVMCAVAYFDPGNWSVDLQAGSQFGYKLLFVVLVSGICAVVLQILATKLGCVTGLDLAAHCRLLLHDHPKYPRLVRWVFLYPLYVLSEIAIISTDLAELLGSAIGLVLIFPKLPLSAAVLLTALDVVFMLLLSDSKQRGKPLRVLEAIIIVLVLIVFVCFIVLIVKVSPGWSDVFEGYLPSKALVRPSGLYASIGILGATVMPHALYLGSHMSTQDRVSTTMDTMALPEPAPTSAGRQNYMRFLRRLFVLRRARHDDDLDVTTPYGDRENNPLSFIRSHLTHGIVDIVVCLLGFAVVINSAILIISGAVFFFGPGRMANNQAQTAGLFDAHQLISDFVGKPAAFIFALALLCSGQTASITATLAGQIVSEGFIQWSISPFLRRLVTRLLGLIPSMIVAVAVGRSGIDTLLIVSQVVLSIVLPFVMFPLVWLTSSSVVMRVKRPRQLVVEHASDMGFTTELDVDDEKEANKCAATGCDDEDIAIDGNIIAAVISQEGHVMSVEEDKPFPSSEKGKGREMDIIHLETVASQESDFEYVDYSNGWITMLVSYFIWLVVVVANGYLIVTLAID